jgi:3-hydroxymyristoyl/3-hydroxydecanoyl-(acyl carrier protein) dehydratase
MMRTTPSAETRGDAMPSVALRSVPLHIAADHPAFAGHFPDRPLVPGVLLLAHVLEAVLADPVLAAAVGPAPRLAVAKFLAPVGPGVALAVRFETTPTALRFEVEAGGRGVGAGHFERAAVAQP